MVIVVAVVIFLFDNLREKRSVPLTITCFKNSCGIPVENHWYKGVLGIRRETAHLRR